MRLDLATNHEIYLISLGYSEQEARNAVNRAIGQAERLVKHLPLDIKDRAFESLLAHELQECESWIDKVRSSAVNSDKWAAKYAEGYRRMGVDIGPRTIDAYRQSARKKAGTERR